MSKLPYMPLYPADLLSNENAIALSMPAFGAWVKTFCIMWRAESGSLTKSLEQWGRAWGCSRRESPSAILAEIETVGTVTKNPDGTITIHSARVEAELARLMAKREKGKVRKERFESREESDSRTHQERVPNAVRTHLDMIKEEYESEYDSSLTSEQVEAGGQEKPREPRFSAADIAAIYQAYPRKVGKRTALDEIERALRRIATGKAGPDPPPDNPVDWLGQRTLDYARSPAGTAGKLTPHPSTWYHQDRFDDDPAEWHRTETPIHTNGNRNGRIITPTQRASLSLAERGRIAGYQPSDFE